MAKKRRDSRSGSGPRRSLWRDDSGAAMIEFAFVAGPFLALIFANLVTALAMFAQQTLDSTTEKMGRQLMTGQVQKAGTSQNAFKNQVCADLPTFLSCSRVMVNVEELANFDAASTGAPTISFDGSGNVTNSWQYQTGDPGEIVMLRVYYRWPKFVGPLGFSLGNLSNGERLLVSTAIFKTEQYQ